VDILAVRRCAPISASLRRVSRCRHSFGSVIFYLSVWVEDRFSRLVVCI
jgi:hypothetical protein